MADIKADMFDRCLQRALTGESLELVLSNYPQWAAEFRPMLQAALAVRSLQADRVPKAALARSRARFLYAAREKIRSRPGLFAFAPLRLGLTTLVVILGLFVGGLTTFAVSAQALPGDTLYPLKLLSEQARLFLAKDAARRLALEQAFDQERINEVDALIQHARSQPVSFRGDLRVAAPNEWWVDGIRVVLAPGAQVDAAVRDGLHVMVDGILGPDGTVLATRIWLSLIDVSGVLEEVSPERWVIGGVVVTLTPETRLDGAPAEGVPFLGSQVQVVAVRMADESLLALSVRFVSIPVIIPASPTRPAATATAVPAPVIQPVVTAEPAGVATPESGESETPDTDDDHDGGDGDETPDSSETPMPTKTPKPTDEDDDDHEADPTPSVSTSTPAPTQEQEATRTPDEDYEEHPTYTPTPTPTQDD